MKKETITVEKLKELVAEYIRLEQDPLENSTEWAYVALEPELKASEAMTLAFLKQMNKEEFDGMCPFFFDVMRRFKSSEMLQIIEAHYAEYYGTGRETDLYRTYISGLRYEVKL